MIFFSMQTLFHLRVFGHIEQLGYQVLAVFCATRQKQTATVCINLEQQPVHDGIQANNAGRSKKLTQQLKVDYASPGD